MVSTTDDAILAVAQEIQKAAGRWRNMLFLRVPWQLLAPQTHDRQLERQITKLCRRHGVPLQQQCMDLAAPTKKTASHMPHLLWMQEELRRRNVAPDSLKAWRWRGYIDGVLQAHGAAVWPEHNSWMISCAGLALFLQGRRDLPEAHRQYVLCGFQGILCGFGKSTINHWREVNKCHLL